MAQYKNKVTLSGSSTYSLTQYDEVISVDLSAIGDNVILTLPSISAFTHNTIGYGKRILIFDESRTITGGTNTITVNASGSDLIDISNTYIFSGENSFSFFVEYVDEGLWTVLVGVDGTSGTSGVDGLTCYEYSIVPAESATTISYNSCSCDNGEATATLLPLIDCGSQSSYNGGYGYPVEQPVNFGNEIGTVSIDFNAVNIPDRFIVYYNNSVALDTGYRGDSQYNYGGGSRTSFTNSLNGLTDPVTGNIYPFSDPSNEVDGYPTVSSPGTVTDTFNKNISSVTYGVIKVYGPMGSTVWYMDIGCPNGDANPSGTSEYSVSICATETPTVIEGDTGITINCVGMCMGSSEGGSTVSTSDNCTKWVYNTGTTASGISTGQIRFNNSNITGATEIYIHTDSGSGSNNWYGYFKKLVETLCCTLKVRIPNGEHDYLIYDYDSSGSTLESNYLKFAVSDIWGTPLLNDSNFATLSNYDELCIEFDLFKCENTNSASGTGDTVSQPCYAYWQYDTTSLSAVTSVNDVEINDVSLLDNGGNGQFTIGVTGGTDVSYTLSVGEPIYIHMSQTNYWGDLANAMNIGANSEVVITQWNNNGTSTTGEIVVLQTSNIIFNNTNNYVVFEGTITQISNGLTNGLSDNTFYCLDVNEIVQPPDPSQSSCEGVFRMGVFTPLGGILISLSGQDQYQVDGEIVSNGLSISSVSGGGIYGALTSDNAYSICSPYNERQFYFAETDYEGNDLSSFFNGLVVGDKLKYELLYDDTNNDAGDYIVFELVQPVTTNTDGDGQTFYILKSVVLLDQSNINSCLGFFSKPNNLVCLSNVSQVVLLPPPPGGDEILYIVERIGSSERPSVTGSTTIESSDITNLSGTTLSVTNIDITGTDNQNRLGSTISYVTMNYLGCSITYEVDSQLSTGANPTYEALVLGDIVTNGFNTPRGVNYSASTVTTGTTMYLRFDTSTDGIVINPGEYRLTTSNGSTNKVVAQPNLKFSGDVLYVTGDTTQYGVLYQKSDEVDNVGTGISAVSYVPTGAGESVFFNYVVKEKSNTCMRTGTVMVVSDGVGTQWTDTSTPDINCSTKGITFDARVLGGNIVLRAIVTQGDWNIRVRNEVIF